jgi:hypothetical protein
MSVERERKSWLELELGILFALFLCFRFYISREEGFLLVKQPGLFASSALLGAMMMRLGKSRNENERLRNSFVR